MIEVTEKEITIFTENCICIVRPGLNVSAYAVLCSIQDEIEPYLVSSDKE